MCTKSKALIMQKIKEAAKTVATKPKTISFDDWFEKYVPVINHLEEDTAYNGTMFDTSEEETEHVDVMAKDFPNHVHTIMEVADNFYILKGFHLVNRWGYFITKFPCDENYSEILID